MWRPGAIKKAVPQHCLKCYIGIRYRNLLPVGRYPYKELGSNLIFNLFPMNREGAVDAKMRRTATLLRTTLPLESQLDNPGGTTGAWSG